MKVEKTGSFQFGFVLNEKNLRRIIGTAKEQLTKVSEKEKIECKYSSKLQNGSIIETTEIENILSIENIGSSCIVRLTLTLEASDNHFITIDFSNPRSELHNYSIFYRIISTDRDWVFVTLSLIEERIILIKRSKRFIPEIKKVDHYINLFAIGMLLFFLTYMFDVQSSKKTNINKEIENKFNFTKRVEEQINKNPNLTPGEVLLFRYQLFDEYEKFSEKAKNEYEKKHLKRKLIPSIIRGNFPLLVSSFVLSGFTLPFIIFFYLRLATILYPLYVFCWGSGQDIFIKKETQRKFLLVTIITGIAVSVIAGLLVEIL